MRGIRNDPAISAVNQQIELFKHGLSDNHLVAQHQSLVQRSSPVDANLDRLGDTNHVLPAVRVLHLILNYGQSKLMNNMRRHNGPYSSSINERIRLVASDLLPSQLTTSNKRFVGRIDEQASVLTSPIVSLVISGFSNVCTVQHLLERPHESVVFFR